MLYESHTGSDEYYTPKYIFDALGVTFDLDVASPADRTHCCVPAKRFISHNSLEAEWNGFVWMNPPFSKKSKHLWFDKIKAHGDGIALSPDRTSSQWRQKASGEADAILFISPRVKFIKPDGTCGGSPSVGTTLWAYGLQAVEALKLAQSNNLGKTFIRI